MFKEKVLNAMTLLSNTFVSNRSSLFISLQDLLSILFQALYVFDTLDKKRVTYLDPNVLQSKYLIYIANSVSHDLPGNISHIFPSVLMVTLDLIILVFCF